VRGVFAGHYVYVDEADHISQSGAAEGGPVGRIIGVLRGPPGLAVGPTLGALAGSQSGSASDVETDAETLVAAARSGLASSPVIAAVAPSMEIDEMVNALATDGASVSWRELSVQERSARAASLYSAPIPADQQRD
jgi:uncharacterized membrane protein